jgi:hypothetical protein
MMYIPEFWCGLIVGVIATFVVCMLKFEM